MALASMLADMEAGGYLGASPISHQVIAGSKEKFTDAHSVVAYELFLKDLGYHLVDGEWYIEE